MNSEIEKSTSKDYNSTKLSYSFFRKNNPSCDTRITCIFCHY